MSSSPRLRVLVAGGDDHALRELCHELATWPTIQIVGWARSTQEAKSLVGELAADVILIDVQTPAFEGPEAIRRIKVKPGAPILVVLTSQDSPGARNESFEAGADAFITKTEPVEKLRALVAKLRPYS